MAIFFRLQEASWELWRWMGSDWGDRVWSLMGGKQRQGNEEVGVSDHLVVVVDSERERKSTTSTASDVYSAFRRPGYCGPNSYSRKNYTILMSRLMIMALLAITVGGMAFLTWYLTQMYFVNSVNTIALQLRQEMLESSKGHFRTLIHNSVTAAQAISLHVNNRDVDDARPAVDYVMNVAAPMSYSLLQLFPNLTVTGYLTASGPFMVYGRTTAESNTQAWYMNNTSSYCWTNSQLDGEGKPVGKAERYDPEFNLAALFKEDQGKYPYKNGPVWKMFSTAPTGPQMVSFIRTRSHQGVAVAGISLRTMSDFMANAMKQPLFRGGYMYFINEEGMLLSVSDGSDVNVTTQDLQIFAEGNFIKAKSAPTPCIAAGTNFLISKVGEAGLTKNELHFSDIQLEGETYYVDSSPLVFFDLTVVGVILLPRHAVMHKVDQRSHMTMVIILLVAASFLVLGFAAIFLFTNRVSTEMELKAELILQLEAKRKAEASSNHKSQFMANMSHELRTPMAGIIGLVDILLSDDSLTSEQMDNVSQIRRCSMALLGLLNNILDLSKVEAGKLGLEKCDFDLGHEVASLVDMFSVQCLSSGVEIALDLSDDFPKMVRGDSARLRQIFANLVSNAIKFTPSGWICVKGWVETPPIVGKKGLAGKDSLSDTVMLHFEVEDTGCGIDPHKWESVFESFVQADASTTRTHGGTGLGLSIVRSLVHMMGGDIGIVPKRSGRGTLIKFFVVLDKVQLDSASATHPTRPQHEFPDEAILEPVLGAQVVWGMAESLGRQIGARWMLARGFEVHEVGTWPEILPTIRDLLNDARRPQSQELSVEMGRGSGGKYVIQQPGSKVSRDSGFMYAAGGEGEGLVLVILDIALLGRGNNLGMEGLEGPLAELQELRDRRGIHVAWLLSPSTSKAVRRRLRDKGYTVVANKPVYQSKLLQLLLWLVGANDRFEDASPEAAPKPMVSQGGGIQVAMEDLYTSDLHGTNSEARTISLLSDHLSDSDLDTEPDSPRGRHQQQQPMPSPPDSSDNSHQSVPTVASSQSTAGSTPYSSFTSSLQAGGSASGPRLKSALTALNEPVASTVRKPLLGKKLNIPNQRFGAGFATPSDTPLSTNTSTTANRSPWPVTSGAGAGSSTTASRLDPVGALLHLGRASAATKCSAAAIGPEDDDSPTEPEDVLGPGQYPLQFEDAQFLRADSHSPSHKSTTTTSTTSRLTTTAADANATSTSATATASESAAATNTPSAASKKAGPPPQAGSVPSSIAKSQHGHGGRHRRLNSRPPNDALAGIHILVAEDTPVLRRLAVLMLQKLGATVTAVGDGLEALMAVTATHGAKIDLVLMDCQMPKMDGYQSTQEIRSAERLTGRHTPIVALTAHAMASDEERCLAVGMDAYLTKPIDSQLLVSTLLNLLQRLQQQRQQSANPNAPISSPPIATTTN